MAHQILMVVLVAAVVVAQLHLEQELLIQAVVLVELEVLQLLALDSPPLVVLVL